MTAAFARCPEPYEIMQQLATDEAVILRETPEGESRLMRIVGVTHASFREAIGLWGDEEPTPRERRMLEKAIRKRVMESLRQEQSTGIIMETILLAIVAEVVKMLLRWWLEG